MRKLWILSALALALGLLSACVDTADSGKKPAGKDELVLAANGKSNYRIVDLTPGSEMEKLAVADLALYLKRITGADFTGTSAKHTIYVGKAAPSDKSPLKAEERRVRSENGDIYIYGYAPYGNAFAVYDFLEEFLGCHWYTLRGREKVPVNPSPVLKALNFSRIPSFGSRQLTSGVNIPTAKQLNDYTRRNRIFALNKPHLQLGPGYGHVPGQLIPPGKKYKEQVFIWKPYKYYTHEEWFDKHPDYFAMNPKGKRVPDKQLCYSNPELRKLFDAKLEEIIAKEYKGGDAHMRCDLNDSNGFDGKTICCCPECMKLVEKYQSPAGPYWEYVLGVCRRFKVEHPRITLGTSAYLSTERIPHLTEAMPDNLLIGFSPLNKNFLKPYDHPTNKRVYDRMKEWGQVCNNLGVQLYPAVYPRATTALPFVANLRQLAQNLRVCKKLNVKRVYGEQGHHWGINGAFNELRQYMLARMLNNVELDENQLIEEFMRDTYGKAAPLMIAYWKELEECEAKEEIGLTWFGASFGTFSYLTQENLVRWSRAFDKMEALVADDPETLRDVHDARFHLDEAMLSVYHKLPKTAEFDRDRIAERARFAFDDGLVPFLAARTPEQRAKVDGFPKFRVKILGNGLEFFYAASGTPGPLPPGLEKTYPGPIHRALPDRRLYSQNGGIQHLLKDPKAAYGVALKSNRGKWTKKNLVFRVMASYAPSGKTTNIIFNDARDIKFSDVKKHPGEYRLYFCGRTRLYPQCIIYLGMLDKLGWVQVGHFFDPKNPKAEYDVYLSVKVDEDGVLWFSEAVLCGTGRECPEQKAVDIAAAG